MKHVAIAGAAVLALVSLARVASADAGPPDVQMYKCPGVEAIRISLRSDFADVSWVPCEPTAALALPDSDTAEVWVEARDGAGNVSPPAMLLVGVVAKTGLDRAIRLEERAFDRIVTEPKQAIAALSASLPELASSMERVRGRIRSACTPDLADVGLLGDLVRIAGEKTAALAFLRLHRLPQATSHLRDALALEREVATRAEQLGRGL